VKIEAGQHDRPFHLLRDEAGEVGRVEDEGRQRDGESQRGDTEEQAPDPQRRQADQQRHQHPGGRTGQQREDEVGTGLAHEVAGDGGAEPGDRELPEADLARPAREHDQGDGHDAVDECHGSEQADLARGHRVRHDDRQRQHGDEQEAPPPHDLRQPGDRRRDGRRLTGRRPAGAEGVVGAGQLVALEEEPEEDHDEQADVDEARPGPVPEHDLLEDADTHAGHHGPRQALHAGQHRRGQRRQQQARTAGEVRPRPDQRCGQHGRQP
jgi:hypothetical protein